MTTKPTISAEDIAAYERDGVVCLRGVLPREWTDLLDRGVDRNIANPGPQFTDTTRAGETARCIKDDWCWEWIPEYREFVERSPMAAAVGELMRASEVCFIEDQYFQKEAGATTPTPWHQDQPYYELKGRWCNSWIPLDPVAAVDSLRFVRGSHASGRLFTPKSFTEGYGRFDIDQRHSPIEALPDIDADPEKYPVIAWDMEVGDCVVFHPRTIHGNLGNRSSHRSRRIALRWVAEDAIYDEKVFPWATFAPNHGLTKGQRVIGEKFPRVWRKD
jgi:ectoine hydroxylase-related dioxygenase (phytanoyl-CoA dioxygenase family)